MTKKLIMGFAALVLFVSACGGDDGDEASEQEEEVIQALRSQSEDGGSNPVEDLTDDEIKCFAKEIVADEALLDAILDDADFEDLDVEKQADAFTMMVDCAGDTLASVMAEGMMEDSALSEEQATCFSNGMLDDRDLLVSMLQMSSTNADPDGDTISALFEILGDCGVSLSDLG